MKELKSAGFTMTLATDEYGAIHFHLSEDQGFLGADPSKKNNKIYRMSRFGITFYGGNSISTIKDQLCLLLDYYGEEVSVAAEGFLMDFLEDEEALEHPAQMSLGLDLN